VKVDVDSRPSSQREARGVIEITVPGTGLRTRSRHAVPPRAVAARRDALLTAIMVLGDLLAISAAYAIALMPRIERSVFRHLSLHAGSAQAVYVTLPVWVAVLACCGLYWRSRRIHLEMRRLVEAVSFSLATVVVLVLVADIDVTAGWVAVVWCTGVPFLALWRMGASTVIRRLHAAGVTGRRVIVVGVDAESRALVRTLTRQPWRGFSVAGFVEVPGGSFSGTVDGLPVWSSLDLIADAVRENDAGAVIVAATVSAENLLAVQRALQPLDIDVILSPGLSDMDASRVALARIDGLTLLALRRHRLGRRNAAVKRALDIAGSGLLLAVGAPLMGVIALAIKRTSPGPVMFVQERVGRGGQPFRMYKFRSMVVDAEALLDQVGSANQADGILFKVRDDPRVYPLGRTLRRFGLDELPQLVNVLRGDMSLVGPRPALPSETEHYDARLHARLLVRPGVTGLWQVNGRHELAFDDYVRYDLFYVANWSLRMDLAVLARTLPALLSRRGAH
jgi:exopolysaccharide biosynthesis polyprenyl glycosylphosphotransferase